VLANIGEVGKGHLTRQNILIGIVIVVLVVFSAFAMVTVSRTFEILPSDFVKMPTTAISKAGAVVLITSVSPVDESNLAVGVQGYLLTASGQPVAGASVYVQYYLEGAYRTQVGMTDSNGFFQIRFPMNWTGWLPLTMVYFGDTQHQGVQQVVSLPGENL